MTRFQCSQSMNSLLQTFSLSFVIFLLSIQRGDLRPTPCKDGNMFYEEIVFDYLNCSLCIEQSHYINCNVCCPATVTPTTSLSTPTTPSVSSSGLKSPSSKVSGIVESVPNGLLSVKPEVLLIIGFFTGFLTMLLIVGWLGCAVKYCKKRKKEKTLGSLTSVRPGMQETQLNPSSPMVMGLSGCDPVAL